MAENVVTIPSKMTKGEELVVIPRSLYEKFSRWEAEEKIVGEVIASGEKAFKKRKTIVADSSKEALRMFYDRKSNDKIQLI